jgi:hypothetical protein
VQDGEEDLVGLADIIATPVEQRRRGKEGEVEDEDDASSVTSANAHSAEIPLRAVLAIALLAVFDGHEAPKGRDGALTWEAVEGLIDAALVDVL